MPRNAPRSAVSSSAPSNNLCVALLDFAVPLVLVGAAGCAASMASAPSGPSGENAADAGAEVAPSYLVWTRDEKGDASTHRVDARDGRPIATYDGVVVRVAGKDYRWDATELPVASEDCPAEMGLTPLEDGHTTRVVLRPVAGGPELELEVVEPSGRDGVNQVQHDVRLLGSVGPYLFVEETEHGFACGAHGFWASSFFVWDATTGHKVELEAAPDVIAMRDKARADLAASKEDELDTDGEQPELTKLVPQWGADGLRLGHQFTISTAYAFSDGAWSSYTRSTVVPSAGVPKTLAPYAPVPPAVALFAQAHPGVTIGGYSDAR
jgi:hypothetical protein